MVAMVDLERPVEEAHLLPQTALLTAVVLEAIRDARRGDKDAWSFLTADYGGWCEARETYGALLGFDADQLRANVLRMIPRHGSKEYHHRRRSGSLPRSLNN